MLPVRDNTEKRVKPIEYLVEMSDTMSAVEKNISALRESLYFILLPEVSEKDSLEDKVSEKEENTELLRTLRMNLRRIQNLNTEIVELKNRLDI